MKEKFIIIRGGQVTAQTFDKFGEAAAATQGGDIVCQCWVNPNAAPVADPAPAPAPAAPATPPPGTTKE